VIRRAVLHMIGEQPLLVDLEALPHPADGVLVCQNVRTMAGRRPTFIDATDSTLVIPYHNVRFLEIPAEALGTRLPPGAEVADVPEEPELNVDEDFLRRVREA
jgi:hypothetical protein